VVYRHRVTVLVICHSSAPQALGGGERSLLELAARWSRERPDVQLEFVVPDPEGLLVDALRARDLVVHTVHSFPWLHRRPPRDAATRVRYQRENSHAVATLRGLIRDLDVHLVITNTILNPWGAVAAGLEGVPHVWLPREYGDLDHGLSFQYGREVTWTDIGRMSDLVVMNSRALAEHAAPWLADAPVLVERPLIDADAARRLQALASPSREPDGPLRLLIAGKISPSKGQLDAVEAVRLARVRGVDVELDIVGPVAVDADRTDVETAVRDAGLESVVRVHGPRADLVDAVGACDVGLVLSSWEAYGRVTVEFLLAGRPVIGYDRGGTVEIVDHGVTGELVPWGDVGGVAEAIARLAADRRRLRELSAAARRRAEELNRPGELISALSDVRPRPRALPELVGALLAAVDELPPAPPPPRSAWHKFRKALTR